MKEIQIEELRDLQMQILDYVDAFCRKHAIKYTISGGTLLGAVRHGGYIPWDDDLDIQMLRAEYNRFTELWNMENNHGYFELVSIESGNNMGYPFGKVHDTRTTTFIGQLERTGVFVDVFPVDNVIDDADFKRRHTRIKKMYKNRSIALSILSISSAHLSLKQRIKRFLMMSYKSYEEIAIDINNLAKKYYKEQTEYVFEMISGMQCKRIIAKEVFSSYIDFRFEDRTFMAVKDYDTYLERTFGNYMQLPPIENRKSVHLFKAYWK